MMQNEKMVLLSLSPSWFPRDRSSIVSSIVTAAAAEAPYAAYRVNEALSNEFFSLSLLILISNYSEHWKSIKLPNPPTPPPMYRAIWSDVLSFPFSNRFPLTHTHRHTQKQTVKGLERPAGSIQWRRAFPVNTVDEVTTGWPSSLAAATTTCTTVVLSVPRIDSMALEATGCGKRAPLST